MDGARGRALASPAMQEIAQTPEELDTLFEDAFLMRDPARLRALFTAEGVLAPDRSGHELRGGEAIGRGAERLVASGLVYAPAGRRVLQARGTALLASDAGIQVARRDGDGGWRMAICLLDLKPHDIREEA